MRWTFICRNSICQKRLAVADANQINQTLTRCKMTCGQYGMLWPRPNGIVNLSGEDGSMINFLPEDLVLRAADFSQIPAENLEALQTWVRETLYSLHPLYDGCQAKKNPFVSHVSRSDLAVKLAVRRVGDHHDEGENEAYLLTGHRVKR